MPENAALVAALIVERPMCLDCIAQRALLSLDGAQIVLDTINRKMPVQRRQSARCQTCGIFREVFSLPRP